MYKCNKFLCLCVEQLSIYPSLYLFIQHGYFNPYLCFHSCIIFNKLFKLPFFYCIFLMLYVNIINTFCTCYMFLSLQPLLSFILVHGICCLYPSPFFFQCGAVVCNFSFYIVKLIKCHDLCLNVKIIIHKDVGSLLLYFYSILDIRMLGNQAFAHG